MISHTIIAEKGYAFIEITQSHELEAYKKATLNFVNDPDFEPSFHRLCDFSQADLSKTTLTEIKAYAKFTLEHLPTTPETKVALVAPAENKLGIFASLVKADSPGNFRMFDEPGPAIAWFNEF